MYGKMDPQTDTSGIRSEEIRDGSATGTDVNPDMSSRDYYYDLNAHFTIHEEILKDDVTMTAYNDSMFNNKHLFKDKIVLDIGCGTGMLSLFAVRAGAKKVIGIDSSNIVMHARQVVAENNLGHVITIVKGKVEEITHLPDCIEKVDIIISNWMGFCLFGEYMLETVVYARDKWLKPEGLLFPDKACLYVTAVEDFKGKYDAINWWNNVYGFNMSYICSKAIIEPRIVLVNPRQVVTDSAVVKQVDLYSVTKEDLYFSSDFTLTVARNDYIHALVVYFSVEFSKCNPRVCLSTSPFAAPTHWSQTICFLDSDITAKRGEIINGNFSLRPKSQNSMEIDFTIAVRFDGECTSLRESNTYQII